MVFSPYNQKEKHSNKKGLDIGYTNLGFPITRESILNCISVDLYIFSFLNLKKLFVVHWLYILYLCFEGSRLKASFLSRTWEAMRNCLVTIPEGRWGGEWTMASSGGSQALMFWEDQETFFKDLDDLWFKNLPAWPTWMQARPPGCRGGPIPYAVVSCCGQVRQMVAGTFTPS